MRSDELIDHTGGNRRRDNQMITTVVTKRYSSDRLDWDTVIDEEPCTEETFSGLLDDAKADGYSEWSSDYMTTFRNHLFMDEFGIFLNLCLMPAPGFDTLREALDASA
jgi:hypothetical protein